MKRPWILSAALLSLVLAGRAEMCTWTASSWASFADAVNWAGGRVPGASDALKPGTVYFDLGGKSVTLAQSCHAGWEDAYAFGMRNGTLAFAKDYRTRSNQVTVEAGGALVFPAGSNWVGGDGMGDDRWEKTTIQSGGRYEIHGAFTPWHASFGVKAGGTFVLAPASATFASSWFPSVVRNSGTLDLPKGLSWSPSGRLGGSFEIRQQAGTLKLGGPIQAFPAKDSSAAGVLKIFWEGGRVEVTGPVNFSHCAACYVAPGAKVELFVAEKASIDLRAFNFGSGATVTKIGPGPVVVGEKTPPGLLVKEGSLINLAEEQDRAKSESALTRPDPSRWQYEPRSPVLATACAGKGLHGRATGLVRLTGENAAGDESERAWRATAWRNERVHGQFVVWTAAAARCLRATVSTLQTAEGQTLPAAAVSTRFVRYVVGHAERQGEITQPEALYGDCLDDAEDVDMPANGYRPVWLTVRVPKDVAPGVYRGTLTLTANAADKVEFPLELKVLSRTLTDAATWPTFVDLWQSPWAIARYHGVKPFSKIHYELMAPYYRELAALGVKVITATVVDRAWGQANNYDIYGSLVEVIRRADGSWQYDYSRFDEYVAFAKRCGLGPQIHCYTLAGLPARYTDAATGEKCVAAEDRKAFWAAFLRDFEAHVREKGWLGNVYLALDESEPEVLRAAAEHLRASAPGLKIAMAGNRKPSEYAGVTIDNYSQYVGHVSPEFLAEAKARKAQGMTTSFYICCGPGRPNTFLRSPLCESAWQGIYTAATGLDGMLRWAAFTWPRDPLFDGSFNHWAPGDTYLLYPGPRLSSRWEMLLDGFELAEKIRLLRAEGATTPTLERLLDPKTFTGTTEFYDARTAAIFDAVDRASETSADWTHLPVIPQPKVWEKASGIWHVPAALGVTADNTAAGTTLVADWRLAFGTTAVREGWADIVLRLAPGEELGREAYRLEITPKGVTAVASTEVGLYWATRTLLQLARASRVWPCGVIRDEPKYRLRGFMLDVARKPYSMAFLRALAKDLAYYKLNCFHIHLNDDGASVFTGRDKAVRAFRLESETYPGLAAADLHYTKDEFRAFVKEAAAMGVTVVPEIDSPAHAGCFVDYFRRAGRKDAFSIVNNFTGTVAFIEKLYDEYLSGSDPVFGGPYVHVGMDEFGAGHQKEFQAYGRELCRIVRKYGKKPCLWGASEHPEKPYDDILVDIWSAGGNSYDPIKMIANGYDVTCLQGGMLYIVPAAGYYNDYLNVRWLHENWEPYVFGTTSRTQSTEPHLFGGKFAVWNDLSGNGVSEDDTFDRVFPALGTVAEKCWTGAREGFGWAAYSQIFAATGEAPGVNLADRLTGAGETVGAQDKAVGWSQGGGYAVDFEIRPSADSAKDEVLFDDGFSRVTLSAEGRLGFTRDGLGHTFATALKRGVWTHVAFEGTPEGVNLLVGGKLRETTKGGQRFCANWCNRGYSLYLREPRTLHFPLVRVPFTGEIRNLSVTTGLLPRVLRIDADKYRRADGFADLAKMAAIVNASGCDEVVLSNARCDGPIEGGKQPKQGEAAVLAFRCCYSGAYGWTERVARTTGVDGVDRETVILRRVRTRR